MAGEGAALGLKPGRVRRENLSQGDTILSDRRSKGTVVDDTVKAINLVPAGQKNHRGGVSHCRKGEKNAQLRENQPGK